GDLLNLSRRGRPRLSLPAEPAFRTTAKFGESIAVPVSSSGLIWCRLRIEPAKAGRLASILYRLPELRLLATVSERDCPERDFRLLPGSAEAGFLLSPLVEHRDDLIRLWTPSEAARQSDARVEKRVTRIRCSTIDQRIDSLLYQPEIVVEFFEVQLSEPRVDESSDPVGIASRVSPTF
ncbi:MAG: hypothetical protein O2983_16350, partial [Planctomycetota bacterium]|nr:hypothetical protein [Planctomycetota bacterium]